MENSNMESSENKFQTVEEAVGAFVDNHENKAAVIDYLRGNKDQVNEFCYLLFETYRPGDKTGLVLLGIIIEELL